MAACVRVLCERKQSSRWGKARLGMQGDRVNEEGRNSSQLQVGRLRRLGKSRSLAAEEQLACL